MEPYSWRLWSQAVLPMHALSKHRSYCITRRRAAKKEGGGGIVMFALHAGLGSSGYLLRIG